MATKYDLVYSAQMKRDFKRMKKRGADLSKFDKTIALLRTGKPLPPKYKDHPLKGAWQGCRDCHIEDDWILIYRVSEENLILVAIRTGTHSDLEM